MASKIKYIFRPSFFETYPQMIFPNAPPIDSKEAIHEASSIVIFPDGNGESSERSGIRLGPVHPDINPNPTGNRYTITKLNVD